MATRTTANQGARVTRGAATRGTAARKGAASRAARAGASTVGAGASGVNASASAVGGELLLRASSERGEGEPESVFIGGPLSRYAPPGPVAAAFLDSDAFVAAIRGPIGSGKSTACAIKLLRNTMKQQRLLDGWVRRRSAVIRNTYPELKTTTIKTWQQWFSPGGIRGAVGACGG
jgi:hypothetical protein